MTILLTFALMQRETSRFIVAAADRPFVKEGRGDTLDSDTHSVSESPQSIDDVNVLQASASSSQSTRSDTPNVQSL
jgi:hypothetical protein